MASTRGAVASRPCCSGRSGSRSRERSCMRERPAPLPARSPDAASRDGSRRAIGACYELAIGLLLFGDYLALSLSRSLTGSAGNWILFTAIAQVGVLLVAAILGRLSGRWPLSLVVGFGGILALML